MSDVPQISMEEKMAGLDKAMRVRRERAALKSLLRRGDVSPAQGLDADAAQGIRVRQYLVACPGIGEAKAKEIMDRVGIAENRRVGGMGRRQRAKLQKLLEELQ